MVSRVPLTAKGNVTLTQDEDLLLTYSKDDRSCETIVNEIFAEYCVTGVFCSKKSLEGQARSPLLGDGWLRTDTDFNDASI